MMTRNEHACLTAAAWHGPLLKTPAGFKAVNGCANGEEAKAFGGRTVMGLHRLGLLLMPDTTQAWISDAGHAALARWAHKHPPQPKRAAA